MSKNRTYQFRCLECSLLSRVSYDSYHKVVARLVEHAKQHTNLDVVKYEILYAGKVTCDKAFRVNLREIE